MPDPTFKPYRQNQMRLLPLDLSEMVPENHMARVVDEVVESLDLSALRSLYPGGGAPAYDPRMMLKVVVYAYASGVYSSRKISEATRSNVYFLWLTGCTALDHMTINRFRTERLRGAFEGIFTDVVLMLAELGHVTLDTYFLDGTKVEANASKFTFVWKKSTDRYQEALRRKVHAHLAAIDELNDEEEALAPEEPAQVDSGTIDEAARKINERLAKREEEGAGKGCEAKALRKAAREMEGDYLPRMRRYEAQQETFGGRNSFSKTDPDATFMRMKDDAMGNGQLKAGYNVQAGTENQFGGDVTGHQRPGDTACAIGHCEHVKERIGRLPRDFVADAGYGSEENYAYLEGEGVNAYVKHNEFFRECRNEKWREDEMRPANWAYDEKADEYACPGGRVLRFEGERRRESDLGFESMARVYACADCSGCPKRGRCLRSKDPGACKKIEVNSRLASFKKRASAMLRTEKGSRLRKKRGTDVETVFGDIKRNHGFTRFLLRGLEKVTLEIRLVAAGHNIRKLFLAESRKGAEAGATA